MKLPKITGAGIEKGAIGIGVLLALGAAVWIVKKALDLGGDVQQAISDTADAVGGSAFDLVNGDANAAQQSTFTSYLAAWKAAGKPQSGSPADIALRVKYGEPPPTADQIAEYQASQGG